MSRYLSRDKQLTSAGLGKHFASPKKQRDKKKTTTYVHLPAKDLKRKTLLAKFAALQQGSVPVPVESHTDNAHIPADFIDEPLEIATDDFESSIPASDTPKLTRRILPDTEAARLYTSWKKLLPSLLDPFLAYTNSSMARAIIPAGDLASQCTVQGCPSKSAQIQCLYFDRELTYNYDLFLVNGPKIQTSKLLQS
jgi:hypothetical protein